MGADAPRLNILSGELREKTQLVSINTLAGGCCSPYFYPQTAINVKLKALAKKILKILVCISKNYYFYRSINFDP